MRWFSWLHRDGYHPGRTSPSPKQVLQNPSYQGVCHYGYGIVCSVAVSLAPTAKCQGTGGTEKRRQ